MPTTTRADLGHGRGRASHERAGPTAGATGRDCRGRGRPCGHPSPTKGTTGAPGRACFSGRGRTGQPRPGPGRPPPPGQGLQRVDELQNLWPGDARRLGLAGEAKDFVRVPRQPAALPPPARTTTRGSWAASTPSQWAAGRSAVSTNHWRARATACARDRCRPPRHGAAARPTGRHGRLRTDRDEQGGARLRLVPHHDEAAGAVGQQRGRDAEQQVPAGGLQIEVVGDQPLAKPLAFEAAQELVDDPRRRHRGIGGSGDSGRRRSSSPPGRPRVAGVPPPAVRHLAEAATSDSWSRTGSCRCRAGAACRW